MRPGRPPKHVIALIVAGLAIGPRASTHLADAARTTKPNNVEPRLRDLIELADQCNLTGSVQLRVSRTFTNERAILTRPCTVTLDVSVRLTLVNVSMATRGFSFTRGTKPLPGSGTELVLQNVTLIATDQDAIGVDLAGPNDTIKVQVATIDAGQRVSLVVGGKNLPGSGGRVELSNVTLRADRSPAGTVTIRAGMQGGGRIQAALVTVTGPGGSIIAAENCSFTFVTGVDRSRLC